MKFLHKYRHVILACWGVLFCAVLYLYFFKPGVFEMYLVSAFEKSFLFGLALFLFLGCVRGFVFIPATALIVLGFLFFTPHVLFVLVMVGVLVSSSLTYWFARSLELGQEFEEYNGRQVRFLRRWLARHELPVVILWSGFPFVPTDIICYVCGALKISYGKFMAGVFIGEAVCSGVYIYYGEYLVRYFV